MTTIFLAATKGYSSMFLTEGFGPAQVVPFAFL
jgi:hypothetical protein